MSGGAWGLGLFQSDYDYDIIQDLNRESLLWYLELDHAKSGKVGIYTDAIDKEDRGEAVGQLLRKTEHERADESKTKRKPNEVYYSVYANLCSNPKLVKQYLENSGMLNRMIISRMARLSNPGTKKDIFRPSYVVVLLGACAMSLGCTLPDEFLQHLRASYADRTRVGLMRDAITQMNKALFGPDSYSNGKPYDFGSKGFDATANSGGPSSADRYFPNMINVPSPSVVLPQQLMAQALLTEMMTGKFDVRVTTQQYLTEKFEMANGDERIYGQDECGGCGAKEGPEGESLVSCARCKGRRYCGKKCQKKDWPKHKVICQPEEHDGT